MRRNAWTMFAALCVLAGSEWLMPPVAGWVRGLVYLVVGLAAGGANGRARWSGWRDVAWLALASALLLGVPEVMAGWAARYVQGTLWTAALAVVPAMVVLVVAQSSDVAGAKGGDARRLLVPALVGLGGVLLLIPVDLPRSSMGQVGLMVMVLGAGLMAIGGVATYRVMQRFSVFQAVAIFCLANSVVLAGAGIYGGWPRSELESGGWVTVLVAAVSIVLLVVLVRGMEPVRMAGRFLVVPLVTIVEGFILLWPVLTVRMGVGAALLAGGAGMLLLLRGSDEDAALSLR